MTAHGKIIYRGQFLEKVCDLDTSCIILAGGKGLRLGYDKVVETVGNKSLLEQVISCVDSFCNEIIVVTAAERTIPQPASYPNLRIVNDAFPGKGPLVGIYTGLAIAKHPHSLVVACDMPFLNQALLRYMIQLAAKFDLIVPRMGNMVEPLHAVYSKSCLAAIERMIEQDNLSVNELFRLVRVRYVETEEIDRFDPNHLTFFNVNTKADLAKARKLARGDSER